MQTLNRARARVQVWYGVSKLRSKLESCFVSFHFAIGRRESREGKDNELKERLVPQLTRTLSDRGKKRPGKLNDRENLRERDTLL